jgi:adenylate cyclase
VADDPVSQTGELTLAQVAAGAGVSPATIRRWVTAGVIPGFDGHWTPSAAAYARVIARLRARGHELESIKRAGEAGQLAAGPIENLLSRPGPRHPLREAARLSGLSAEMIERVYATTGLGLPPDGLSDEDVQFLKYVAAVLDAGLPLTAFVQLIRVYSQAIAQIADAEVRLIHLYVHEPLMRSGVPSVEIAEEMEGLAREVLPFATPFMNYLHERLLAQFVEQDMIGHMEADISADTPLAEGRVRVAIAFADLAGYARLTVELGDEAALRTVERFVAAAEQSLPVDARVIKTLGDEVMVVGSDTAALTAWAVELGAGFPPEDPPPRIGIHYGEALYRDGDYFGRDVNQAARVVARAAGGEVLVTRPVVELAGGVDGLEFRRIGEVRLKGFSEPTELFTAALARDD